jgi:DNA polymerase III subunit epsilon
MSMTEPSTALPGVGEGGLGIGPIVYAEEPVILPNQISLAVETVQKPSMLKHIRLERPLVVLDLETTGRRVQADRIVEISTLKLLPDGTDQIRTRRFNPGVPIPPDATAVHGITDDDVAEEKSFSQIARSLAAYLDGCDLCGYNLWGFDLKMLVAEFKRAGVPFSTAGRHILDPMRIFHKREPRDLTAALKFYCSMGHEGAHGAEADVLAALLVLDAQVERYDELPRTVSELHEHMGYPDMVDPDGKFVRREDGTIEFAFSDHIGKTVDDVARDDPGFLEWMLKKDFSDEAKAVVRETLKRRKTKA